MRGICLLTGCLLTLLMAVPTAAQAPASPAAPAATGGSPAEVPTPASTAAETRTVFPYTGKVTADLVNIRCGPGLYYYPLATLKQDTPVVVESQKDGWLAIRPPEEVFGLARKSDLAISQEGTQGTVTAPSTRVYTSSPGAKRQWYVAATLKQDDRVTITGPAEGDFVKVLPPPQARAYIADEYVTASTAGAPPTTGIATLPDVDMTPPDANPLMQAYKKAEADLAAELRKVLEQRNYEPLAQAFKEIAEKADKAYIKQTAERRLAYIEQLVQEQTDYLRVLSLPERLDESLAEIKTRWAQQQSTAAAEKRMGGPDFVATGCVRKLASLEGVDYPIKYKLVDQNDKPLILLKSTQYDLANYVGKIVGVRGTKEYIQEWRINCVTVDDLEVLEE
ncbi:MAG: hypothetical protein ISS74_08405 [Planctomycetes bacterium]|nr:hypothetical protein [Planctomycetota bacterium]